MRHMLQMLHLSHPQRTTACAGFSLIEVLVALSVLCIGAIACLAMQLAALRMAREAAYQAEAVRLAAEMVEILAISSQGAAARLTDIDIREDDEPQPPASACYREVCTPRQFMDASFHDWIRRVRHALPQARIRVCFDAATADPATGRQGWECGIQEAAAAVLAVKIGWASPGMNEGRERASLAGFAPRVVFFVPRGMT